MHDENTAVYSVKCKAGLKKFYRCKSSPRLALISSVTRGPTRVTTCENILFVNPFMTEAVILQKPVQWTGFYMIPASAMEGLTTFTERKNIIFLLLFLKVSINQLLASNKDFMVFSFFV